MSDERNERRRARGPRGLVTMLLAAVVVAGLGAASTHAAFPCQADITGDGVVNVSDLLEVLAQWGPCAGCAADVNGDDVVDVSDMLEVLAEWGPCP